MLSPGLGAYYVGSPQGIMVEIRLLYLAQGPIGTSWNMREESQGQMAKKEVKFEVGLKRFRI